MAYTVTWFENGFHAKFTGTLGFAGINGARSLFFEDERATHVRYMVYDFSDVETFILEELDPNYFAITDKGSNSYIREIQLALVAKDPSAQQLCKEYIKKSQTLGSTWMIKLFDNPADAQSWVDC